MIHPYSFVTPLPPPPPMPTMPPTPYRADEAVLAAIAAYAQVACTALSHDGAESTRQRTREIVLRCLDAIDRLGGRT